MESMDYIEYEKDATRNYIKNLYAGMQDKITDDVLKTPLRKFTYEKKRNFIMDGSLVTPHQNLALLTHQYIHKFNVKLDKDVTLEDALKSI